MKEVYNKAKKYAQDVNELGMDYALLYASFIDLDVNVIT